MTECNSVQQISKQDVPLSQQVEAIALQCYDCKSTMLVIHVMDSLGKITSFDLYPLILTQDKPILCGVCLKLLRYKLL